MPTHCHHALNSGEPCSAPAINGSSFCRHHDPDRPRKDVQARKRKSESLELPDLDEKSSILVALSEVVHALAEHRIKCSEGKVLIAGLKLALQLMIEIEKDAAQVAAGDVRDADPATGSVCEPTSQELEELVKTLQNGDPDQLIQQIKSKQAAWARQSEPHSGTLDIAATGETLSAAIFHP